MVRKKLSIEPKMSMTPREVVEYLDQYVVGQKDAKMSVAIALRNRWRRGLVDEEMRGEIHPHNILMVGPTGVGKTEIARRLAKMVKAPFIKVEATKFTEVGYVGRDVESIIRDLLDISIGMVRSKMHADVEMEAKASVQKRIIEALVGKDASYDVRHQTEAKLASGMLEDTEVEIEIADSVNPTSTIMDIPGMQMGMVNVSDMLNKIMGSNKTKTARMKVSDARKILLREESDKLVDEDAIISEAINNVEQGGIVFLDEIDKVCSSEGVRSSGQVSREGVQRDLLPLVEGASVSTKYGPVKTDHILFIASGAFHLAKPSDLLPELQGRFPIRVELKALQKEDMVRILKEPKHSLLKQYKALFAVEDVAIEFTEDGIQAIAAIAADVNQEVENIGARRLHTVLEKMLEGINFTASDTPGASVIVDKEYVHSNLADLKKDTDLSKFIL